jgi:hypothetical protein
MIFALAKLAKIAHHALEWFEAILRATELGDGSNRETKAFPQPITPAICRLQPLWLPRTTTFHHYSGVFLFFAITDAIVLMQWMRPGGRSSVLVPPHGIAME